MDFKLFLSWILSMASLVFMALCQDPAAASLPCLEKLLPCEPYLHSSSSSSPPESCCNPLTMMLDEQPDCLCEIFNNPSVLKSFNLTKDDALNLPKACGAKPDVSICKNGTTPANSTPSSSNPSKDGSSNQSSAYGIFDFGRYSFVAILVAFFI